MANENGEAAPQTFKEWADAVRQSLQVIHTEAGNAGEQVESLIAIDRHVGKIAEALLNPPRPAIDDAMVESIWRSVLADCHPEVHDGCESNTPSDCSLYDAIREALKGGAS
jgi:hypothetical protein